MGEVVEIRCECGHGKSAHRIGQVQRPHNRDTGYVIECTAVGHDDISEWKCGCGVYVIT